MYKLALSVAAAAVVMAGGVVVVAETSGEAAAQMRKVGKRPPSTIRTGQNRNRTNRFDAARTAAGKGPGRFGVMGGGNRTRAAVRAGQGRNQINRMDGAGNQAAAVRAGKGPNNFGRMNGGNRNAAAVRAGQGPDRINIMGGGGMGGNRVAAPARQGRFVWRGGRRIWVPAAAAIAVPVVVAPVVAAPVVVAPVATGAPVARPAAPVLALPVVATSLTGPWEFGRLTGSAQFPPGRLCQITLTLDAGPFGNRLAACHPNESYWILDGDDLVFRNDAGMETTRFQQHGPDRWEGSFRGTTTVHYLARR